MDTATETSARLPVAAPLPKTPTGIAGLDEITLGGLPRGRSTLICGGAGCGKTLFAASFPVSGAGEVAGMLAALVDDQAERQRGQGGAGRAWP